MPNITVTVSQEAYRAARVWAAQNDTSISAILKFCIERLPTATVRQSEESGTIPIAPSAPSPEDSGL